MKIIATAVNVDHFPKAMGEALRQAMLYVMEMVSDHFLERHDERTLVIVFTCPHCQPMAELDMENSVLVTPFKGVEPTEKYRGKLYAAQKYPPTWGVCRLKGEARSEGAYVKSVKRAIRGALAHKSKYLA